MCPGGDPPGGGDKPPGEFTVKSYDKPKDAAQALETLKVSGLEFTTVFVIYKEK